MRKRDLHRRRLVTAGLCLVSAAALPRLVLACAAAPARTLSFFNTLALELARGGVGYYPKSDFVHLDTGRVRRWNG